MIKRSFKKLIHFSISFLVLSSFMFAQENSSLENSDETPTVEVTEESTLNETDNKPEDKSRLDVSFEDLAETSSVKVTENESDDNAAKITETETEIEDDVKEISTDDNSEKDIKSVTAPEIEESKIDEPKIEEPKIEEPKIEEPKIEEPKIDESEKTALGGIGEVPPAKRPKEMDKEKAAKAAEKDENKDEYENNLKTIRYGIPSEIGELLDKIIENDDPRYSDEIYDLFKNATNASIKEKVLKYFTKTEDPCLEDFAVNLLNDPYDEKKEVVNATFRYIRAVKTKQAVPPIITLLEAENEDYFNEALATIGEIGGKKEAKFIAEYLEREDLTDAQRQTLMRTLGKMKATNCWNQIVNILEDEDENAFVRMYAAEALGLMEKDDAVPVLVRNYSASDPNLRQYVIKGLAHFPTVLEAKATIVQAVRDEHWKVRQEAINVCKENEYTDAVPYLIYRAKNDSEKLIKNASFEAIAKINTKEGNDFLLELLADKKTGDGTKQKVAEVLLKEGHAGEKEILELADACVGDDKKKNLRYALGKELAKNSKPQFEEICSKYLASKDATTIGLGLDMYKNCKFPALEPQMREIAKDKKANTSIKNRIKKMLDIQDEEEEKKEDKKEDDKSKSS